MTACTVLQLLMVLYKPYAGTIEFHQQAQPIIAHQQKECEAYEKAHPKKDEKK